MFKLMHSATALDVIHRSITLRSDISARSTRISGDGSVQIPRARSEFARLSVLSRAVRAWNKLPIQVLREVLGFGNRLRAGI